MCATRTPIRKQHLGPGATISDWYGHAVGRTDVGWADNTADCGSMSRYVFSLGSTVIAWSSKKRTTVALSSTESEYRGEVVATCEAIWLKRLLKDL